MKQKEMPISGEERNNKNFLKNIKLFPKSFDIHIRLEIGNEGTSQEERDMQIKGMNLSAQKEQRNNITVAETIRSSVKKEQAGRKTLFAGDTNLMPEETVMTRLQANKKAMKAILDTHKNEVDLDQGISEIKQTQQKRKAAMDQASEAVLSLRAQRQNLKEAYGVSEDSEEELNLKALEKSLFSTEELNEEEQGRLRSMGPLTEYQKEALYHTSMEQIWQRRAENAKNGIYNDSRTIAAIQLERLKSHAMVDAQKEAVKIMEAAGKQITGMLMEDVKEQFDEELEEKTEEAKQQQKEQQEEEARLEKAKLERESLAAKTEGRTENSFASLQEVENRYDPPAMDIGILEQELQLNLMELAKKQNMSQEDIKGILVDELI